MNCPERCKVTVLPPDIFAEPIVNCIEKPRPKADTNKFYFKTTAGLAFEAEGVRKHILEGMLLRNKVTFIF